MQNEAGSMSLADEDATMAQTERTIAWAIVEYLHEHKKAQARTLFATHYHELNEMEKNFPRIKNFNVSVREVDGKVIFSAPLTAAWASGDSVALLHS